MIIQLQVDLGRFSVGDMFPWMWWINKVNRFEAKIKKNFLVLDRIYDEIIAVLKGSGRRNDGTRDKDMVDVLLRLQGDPNQEISLTNEQIKGLLTNAFKAGSDTTAAAIVWTMTELMRHPAIMKKARDEVRGVAGGKSFVPERDLSNMDKPPLPLLLPKVTGEDCRIMGYDIPTGTTVFINGMAISTDPRSWESPGEFNPDRFLKEGSSIDYRGHDFNFLPFGAGRRGCPGIDFGVMMIKLALANLLNRFDWELPLGMTVEDIDLEERHGLATHKKNPLPLVPILVTK